MSAGKTGGVSREHADKNYYVIAYINCSAGVKALSDVICTSGNAEKIVRSAPADRNILFVPDQNLGAWVMERTGRQMDLWQGNCYVHVEFTARSIGRIREEYPDAPVVAHPECTYAVRMLADEVCSTEKMVTFCKESPAREIIVVTEAGMLHRLEKEIPGKNFIPGPTENCFCGECRFMKMNTLEKAHDALLEHGAGDHSAGAAAQARRSADSAHAGIKQVKVTALSKRRIFFTCHFSLVPLSLRPCETSRSGSCSRSCCSAFFFCASRAFSETDEIFLRWLLKNSQTAGATAPLTVVEIGNNPLAQKPAGEKESTEAFLHTGGSTISPLEFALFLQSVLEFQPTVVAFENILKWRERDKDQEQVFLDQAMRVPKLLLAAELTDTPDPDAPVVEMTAFKQVTWTARRARGVFRNRASNRARTCVSSPRSVSSICLRTANTFHVPLLFQYRGEVIPSFTLQALMLWLRVTPAEVKIELGSQILLPQGRKIPIRADGTVLDRSEGGEKGAADEFERIAPGRANAGKEWNDHGASRKYPRPNCARAHTGESVFAAGCFRRDYRDDSNEPLRPPSELDFRLL